MAEPSKFRRADISARGRCIACGCVGEQFGASRGASGACFDEAAADKRGGGGVDAVAGTHHDNTDGAPSKIGRASCRERV